MRLIGQGQRSFWLAEAPAALPHAPAEARQMALRLAAPGGTLVALTDGGTVRAAAAAGWVTLALPGRLHAIRTEGAPVRVTAWRFWTASEALIPEPHWQAARFVGEGALLALAGGPARPMLRLAGGAVGWIELPPLALPGPLEPVLAALRGPLPCAELAGMRLTLRTGAACEVLWEDVQLRPNSRANSA